MFYPALLVAFFSATLVYATGQILIIDGVVGGVPKDPPPQAPSLDKITHRIPGSLRVTENSGVCGMTINETPSRSLQLRCSPLSPA